MPLVITAVLLLAVAFIVFAMNAHADQKARRDRDSNRSQTRPPSTP